MKIIFKISVLLFLIPTLVFAFEAGQDVGVYFKNGTWCEAVIVVPGRNKSKVEYTEFCDINWMHKKSTGEVEWVPNKSIQ